MSTGTAAKNTSLRSSLLLLLCATLWGTTFVAQSIASDIIQPFTYLACRSLLGFVCVLPLALLLNRNRSASAAEHSVSGLKDSSSENKIVSPGASVSSEARSSSAPRKSLLLIGGLLCGLFLCTASFLQQTGIGGTTVGKAGFITALDIVIVPILGLFLKRYCSPLVIPAVVLAIVGFYLLCIKEGFSVNRADLIVLISSFVYSLQILTVDHFSRIVNPIRLSCLQLLFCGLFSMVCAFLFESPDLSAIWACRGPIAYAGILSSAVAYTLQILGQRGLHPAAASLLMSLESVIAALSGLLILGDALSSRELLGCVLVFAAVILAQLPVPHRKKPDPAS